MFVNAWHACAAYIMMRATSTSHGRRHCKKTRVLYVCDYQFENDSTIYVLITSHNVIIGCMIRSPSFAPSFGLTLALGASVTLTFPPWPGRSSRK